MPYIRENRVCKKLRKSLIVTPGNAAYVVNGSYHAHSQHVRILKHALIKLARRLGQNVEGATGVHG